MAYEYASLSKKMLQNDIKELEKMDIVLTTRDGVIVNREIILAFLPVRKKVT